LQSLQQRKAMLGVPITISGKTASEAAGSPPCNNAWMMCAGSAAIAVPVRIRRRQLPRPSVRRGTIIIERLRRARKIWQVGNISQQIRIARRLALGFLLCVCAGDVYGQTTSVDREIKAAPGREVRVGIYTSMRSDCTAGPLPAIRLAVAPEHGSVTVRRATLKATNVKECLATELPAFVAFYRPKADSATDDHFELEVNFAAGRKQIQHFHVTISTGVSDGQPI
jgi:hypothetical protein